MSTDNIAKNEDSSSAKPPITTTRTNPTMPDKADHVFPVARVDGMLWHGRYSKRYSRKASIYLTSVLEYLATIIIEKGGEETKAAGRVIISPRDLMKGIENHEQLTLLLAGDSKNIHIADAIDAERRVPAKLT